MDLEQKVDRILQILESAPASAVDPPDVPELRAADIDPATFDGQTIQRDGSTWCRAVGYHDGDPGQAVGIIYGYISKRKDPAMWARMVEVIGGDEERLQQLLAANGPFARYKVHPNAVLYQGGNSFLLLSQLVLSAPLPEARPTVAG